MGLSIPNTADAAYPAQAAPDSREFDAMVAGDNATYVVTGCVTTFHSAGANMSVDVTSGAVASAGTGAYVTAGTLTIGAAHASLDRFDLVVASSAGVLSVVAGTAAASPAFPTITAGSVLLASVYVPATVTSITAAMVTDKRVIQTAGPYFDQHFAHKNFRASKGRIASRSQDWLLLGDSILEGYFATTEDNRAIAILRKIMQAAINPAGVPGGEGYVPAEHGADPTSVSLFGAPALADRWVLSGAGATAGSRTTNTTGLGRKSVALTASTAVATRTTSTCDRFWILFEQSPSHGNMSIVVDGGAAVLLPCYNATETRTGRIWDSGPLTRGVHTIVVKPDNTATTPANVYNVVLEGSMEFDGDGAAGPANMLTAEWANIDGNYDPVTLGGFWNLTALSQSACTVARSSAQAFQGTYSLAMTCSGAATPFYLGGMIQVKPLQRLTFSYRVRSAVTPRPFEVVTTWLSANADGSPNAQLSNSFGSPATSTTSGWTTVSLTVTVPAGAYWVNFGPWLNTTPAASEVHYIDAWDIGLTSYNGAGVINTTYQDPNSGAAQGRGVRFWDGTHAAFQTSDFTGAASTGTTVTTTGQWVDAIDAVNPDVILIAFGTNEINNSISATVLRDNLITLITNIRNRCLTITPSIVLMSFWPFPHVTQNAAWTAQDGYRDQIRAAALATQCGFLDMGAYFPTTNDVLGGTANNFPQPSIHDLLFEDGVHLTNFGQPEIAQTLKSYFLPGDPAPTTVAPLNNYTATTDPTVSSDITLGYLPGSEWVNTTKRITWKCTDPTANAAVWEQVKRGPLGSLTSTAVTSSTTETVLLTGSVFANAWYSGEHIDFELIGLSSSTGTIIFKVHVGTAGTTSDALAATFTTSAAQVANQRAGVRGKIQCRTTGSSGTVYVDGLAFAGTALLPLVTGAAATATVNTTVAQKITVTGTCSSGTFTAELGQIG